MKHYLLLLLLGCCYAVQATHNYAADVSAKLLLPLRVQARVVTYTRWASPSNLADRDSVTIYWGDGTSSAAWRVNGPDQTTGTVPSPNGVPDGVLLEGTVRENIYLAEHQYAAMPASGVYTVSFLDANRVDGVANIQNGNSVNTPLYIEAVLNINNMTSTLSHNTPLLTVPPIHYASINDTLRFNPGAYDADGDLLEFSLVTPLQDSGLQVPSHRTLNEVCPDRIASINADNGDLVWITPCQVGIYSIAILVKEYRYGLLLSTTMRDMVIIVGNGLNPPPVISNVFDTIIAPGNGLTYTFEATVGAGDSVILDMFPPQYLSVANSPVLYSSSTGNPAAATFSWQPDTSWLNEYPYIFTIRGKDNYMRGADTVRQSTFRTFRVWVADSNTVIAGVKQTQQDVALKLYPNPAQHYLNIAADMPIEAISIHSADGKVLFNSAMTNSGQKIDILGYAAGVYHVRVYIGGRAYTRKFVKYAD